MYDTCQHCLQVFLDCIEQFNLMVNSKGSIVHSELKGTLQMKAYLSGMPECKLGLNDKTMFARQVGICIYTCARDHAHAFAGSTPQFRSRVSGCHSCVCEYSSKLDMALEHHTVAVLRIVLHCYIWLSQPARYCRAA